MNWDDLRHLLAVRRSGSLTKAARLLKVDKATVSRRIESLSDAMKVPLVEHMPRGLRLTRAGEIAAEAAERIDAEVKSCAAEIGQPGASSVRMTVPVWFAKYLVMPSLPRFRAEFPNVEIRLLTTSDVLDLPGRRADIALRNVRPTQAGLLVKKAGRLGSAIYGTRPYLDANGLPRDRDELARHHFVAYEGQVSYVPGFSWLNGRHTLISFRATDALGLLDAALGELGLAILPCFLGDKERALSRVSAFGVEFEDIFVVTQADLKRSRAVRAASAWLADLFSQHAKELAGDIDHRAAAT